MKMEIDSIRTLRDAILELAFALGPHPNTAGYLVLVNPAVTTRRIVEEWQRLAVVIRSELRKRMTICVQSTDKQLVGLTSEILPEWRAWLSEVVQSRQVAASGARGRPDFAVIIEKLLLYQSLILRTPVTVSWLAKTAGCTYPTVAKSLDELGSLIDRNSARAVSLRYLPEKELASLFSRAEKARSTMRFADNSGQPRSPEQHLRRLEKLGMTGIGVGGVTAARHYLPSLDLVGTPRLDLSIHSASAVADASFIEQMDPALEPQHDSRKPANVVVHMIRQADPLFMSRESGLSWVDPIECLFDLHESRLEAQATEFMDALRKEQVFSGK